MDTYFLWKPIFPDETKVNVPRFSSINNLGLKIKDMTDDLDFISNLSHDEKLLEDFRLDCISPNDGKYRKDSDPLRPYISARADWMGCAQVLYVMLKKGVEFDRGTEENVKEMDYAMTKIDPVNMDFLEKKVTHHDMLAVIEEIGRYVSSGTKALLHPGTTSYDLIDTSRSYNYKKAWKEVIRPKVIEVKDKLCDLGELYVDVLRVGRTHLKNTSPVSFGGEIIKYARRIAEGVEESDKQFSKLKGKISGIVGTGAGIDMNFPGRAEEFEALVLKEFDLEPDTTATQIVQKDSLIRACNSLIDLDAPLVDCAEDTRLSYSSAIQEVTSRDSARRLGGSSTDAGKDNPILYEHIIGKYSTVKSASSVIRDLAISNFERDLKGSVQARYQPPNMFAEVYQSFCKASKAFNVLSVNVDKMKENLQPVRDFPTEAMTTILKGKVFIHPEYGLAHDFVKKMMIGCNERNREIVKSNKEFEKNNKPEKNKVKLLEFCLEDKYFQEAYNELPDVHKRILNGELEEYLGFARKRASDNIEYARKVI